MDDARRFDPAAEPCPDCGGSTVAGKVAVPIIGTLRFVYRLGTNEIATEVAALMCGDCGRVTLRAKDPALIQRAQRAGLLGRAAPTWGLKPRREAVASPDEPPEGTN
jgi:hypothetical protein